jgi:hypothetical protein
MHILDLAAYAEARRPGIKTMIWNFTFDMINVIPLRPFGGSDYIFIKYNPNTVTNLKHLRDHVQWKHIESLDSELRNDKLVEDGGKFREYLQMSYHHKKILISDELKYIFPK